MITCVDCLYCVSPFFDFIHIRNHKNIEVLKESGRFHEAVGAAVAHFTFDIGSKSRRGLEDVKRAIR